MKLKLNMNLLTVEETMKTVSLLEFRKNARRVIRWAQQGRRMILTYRGEPVLRLEPLLDETPEEDDPFYKLNLLAEEKGKSLSNEEIDRIVYDE